MTPNSAYALVNIEVNKDYSLDNPIFAIHCTKSNSKPLKIISFDGNETVFPSNSFVQGAIYWIYIKTISDLGEGSFIGYKYQDRPFHL